MVVVDPEVVVEVDVELDDEVVVGAVVVGVVVVVVEVDEEQPGSTPVTLARGSLGRAGSVDRQRRQFSEVSGTPAGISTAWLVPSW